MKLIWSHHGGLSYLLKKNVIDAQLPKILQTNIQKSCWIKNFPFLKSVKNEIKLFRSSSGAAELTHIATLRFSPRLSGNDTYIAHPSPESEAHLQMVIVPFGYEPGYKWPDLKLQVYVCNFTQEHFIPTCQPFWIFWYKSVP